MPLPLTAPTLSQRHLNLELKPIPPSTTLLEQQRLLEDQLQAAQQSGHTAQARTLETSLQGLHALQILTQRPPETHATISLATLGPVSLLAIPGELYHSLGLAIQQSAEHVMLFGYTNGYLGYFPTRATYSTLDYEALISPFAPGSGEQIRDASIELLRTSL